MATGVGDHQGCRDHQGASGYSHERRAGGQALRLVGEAHRLCGETSRTVARWQRQTCFPSPGRHNLFCWLMSVQMTPEGSLLAMSIGVGPQQRLSPRQLRKLCALLFF